MMTTMGMITAIVHNGCSVLDAPLWEVMRMILWNTKSSDLPEGDLWEVMPTIPWNAKICKNHDSQKVTTTAIHSEQPGMVIDMVEGDLRVEEGPWGV
jgi:hypothetical protein